jgi:hypothetical protein
MTTAAMLSWPYTQGHLLLHHGLQEAAAAAVTYFLLISLVKEREDIFCCTMACMCL